MMSIARLAHESGPPLQVLGSDLARLHLRSDPLRPHLSGAASQRSREEVIQAVRSAKTARLAATARLHASAYFPTTSTSASSSSSRSPPPVSRSSARYSKKRTMDVIRGEPSDEESDTTASSSRSDVETGSDNDD
ncbi:hypothetical protein CF319_g8770 [Tilletia indica]|nr:hypothetical protein CF319_g8770 [Tilletia indica]